MDKFLIGQAVVRTVAIITTLVAIVLMTISKQKIHIFGFDVDAKFSYTPAFKFYVATNIVACVFAVLSFSVLLRNVRLANPGRKMHYIIFLLDLAVMVFVLIGSAAATAIGYLGRYGNSHAGWMPICDHFGKFCHKTMASLVFSYISVLLFTILIIWSSWKSSKLQVLAPEMEKNMKFRDNKIGMVA
ncbi:hypothetical protein IFM89_031194 [Coptis chinensis]|uniref:CASP-like protein n=1 Tax=Coptis chinensis TaxID=261450 RepID=A0A835MG03_9MAGN|nr:hypothetical protein IFM89_031194 [Coptis chinensis]